MNNIFVIVLHLSSFIYEWTITETTKTTTTTVNTITTIAITLAKAKTTRVRCVTESAKRFRPPSGPRTALVMRSHTPRICIFVFLYFFATGWGPTEVTYYCSLHCSSNEIADTPHRHHTYHQIPLGRVPLKYFPRNCQ